MSGPAVGPGRIEMAYPDSKGNRRHDLACIDRRTGQEYWKQPIEDETITAPVLAGGKVRFATLGGTPYCLTAGSSGTSRQCNVLARGRGGGMLLRPVSGGRRERPTAAAIVSRSEPAPPSARLVIVQVLRTTRPPGGSSRESS
jgi:hypothetical protein